MKRATTAFCPPLGDASTIEAEAAALQAHGGAELRPAQGVGGRGLVARSLQLPSAGRGTPKSSDGAEVLADARAARGAVQGTGLKPAARTPQSCGSIGSGQGAFGLVPELRTRLLGTLERPALRLSECPHSAGTSARKRMTHCH